MKKKIKHYTPNYILNRGILVWKDMFYELFEARDLLLSFFIRDFKGKYKQSFLGFFWLILTPLFSISAFLFLKKNGVLVINDIDIPYPLFALIGFCCWQLFSSGLRVATSSLTQAGSMIGKINFPKETIVLSSLGIVVFEFLIKTILIALCFIYYGISVPISILIFPLVALPLIIFTAGLSLMMALLNGIFRDIQNIVMFFTTFLMFLTPVFYPISHENEIINILNVLSPLVTAPRDILIYGYIQRPDLFMISSILSLMIFMISWRVFHIAETIIAERA